MRQCNEHETNAEYQRSSKELRSFLRDDRTLTDLGSSCVAAIIAFAESLMDKEKYLGNHIRLYTTNCMDSETTSPVESQNSIVKEKLGVNANMDIHRSIEKITKNTNRAIHLQKEAALRALNQVNLSSRAPTKNIIIAKTQAIADHNYDERSSYKLCKIGSDKWLCWCFESANYSDMSLEIWPSSALPGFLRVRKIIRKFSSSLTFLWCDCGFYDRCGVPCSHIFRLVDEMSINMIHVRHWKVYDAHYGDNTTLGQLMIQAQVRLLYPVIMVMCKYDSDALFLGRALP